jgi:ketosteroid isomerase-like protein
MRSEAMTRMNWSKWFVVFVIVSIVGCRRHDDPAEAKRAVEAQDKVFEDAFNKMNVTGIMSVYWESPDLIAMYPDGTFRGYDDVKQSWWDFFNNVEVRKFRITESHIEVSGDFAYDWGLFIFEFQPKSGPLMSGTGRFLETWKHIGKHWVIVADHASSPMRSSSPDSAKN